MNLILLLTTEQSISYFDQLNIKTSGNARQFSFSSQNVCFLFTYFAQMFPQEYLGTPLSIETASLAISAETTKMTKYSMRKIYINSVINLN